MTSFRKSSDDCNRLDFSLLQNGAISGYTDSSVFEHDLHWLRNQGYVVYALDASEWRSKEDFYAAAKATLHLATYCSPNLDSFDDCVDDIEIPDSAGAVVSFRNFEFVLSIDEEFAVAILDILAGASRMHLLFGKRLIVLIQTEEPILRWNTFGGSGIMWDRPWYGRSL
jgi:RNAse (barnase) inhibitor barstar